MKISLYPPVESLNDDDVFIIARAPTAENFSFKASDIRDKAFASTEDGTRAFMLGLDENGKVVKFLESSVNGQIYKHQIIASAADVVWDVENKVISTALLDTNRTSVGITIQNLIEGTSHALFIRKQSASNLALTFGAGVYAVGSTSSGSGIVLSGVANTLYKLSLNKVNGSVGVAISVDGMGGGGAGVTDGNKGDITVADAIWSINDEAVTNDKILSVSWFKITDIPVDVVELEQRVADLESIAQSNTGLTGYAYAVWSGTGLNFNVFFPAYYIGGIRYEAGSGSLTLNAADPTNPRLDVIALNAAGPVKITGTPSADPVKPTIDPATQIEITTVLISDGATTPEITNEVVYNENTEWTVSSNNGTLNANNTSSPYSGSKCIDIGSFNNTHTITFADGGTNNLTSFGVLSFALYLKTSFASTTYLRVRLLNGTTPVTGVVSITSGLYNFVRTTTLAYQTIVIPTSAFPVIAGVVFDKIEISFVGSNTSGFKMDYVVLQTGSGSASPSTPSISNIATDSGSAVATNPNDTFSILGAGGASVSASGKTIVVTQKNQVIPFATLSGFPVTGVAGVIYIDEATNLQYRWNGTSYAPISAGASSSKVFYRFNSNLFTEQALSYRGLISSLSGYFTNQLTAVSFEVRVDTTSTWTSIANLTALQSWITSNITGNEASGTVYWIKVLATYGSTSAGEAEYRLTYTAS